MLFSRQDVTLSFELLRDHLGLELLPLMVKLNLWEDKISTALIAKAASAHIVGGCRDDIESHENHMIEMGTTRRLSFQRERVRCTHVVMY